MNRSIKAFLFDFDDTLVDTVTSKVPAIREYCRMRHGISVSDEDVTARWGRPFSQMMGELIGDLEIDINAYLALSKDYPLLPFPEAEETLRSLSEHYPVGIVTSLSKPVLMHSLELLKWPHTWFSVLIAQEDSSAHKPDPRVFDPALHALGIGEKDRQGVVYIGDLLIDAYAARDAGLTFIGVARDSKRRQNFDSEMFTHVNSLRELPHFQDG